jgi:excinuclease ABC subunit C
MKMEIFKKLKLPDKPGVYFFLGPSKRSGVGLKGREILYIGKATSLKDRVKSYFGKDLIGTRGPIILDMVFKAEKIDWQTTDSVLEALILEANLIKKHQPKYNTKEKSDKSFNYVCITKDKLPKVIIVRGKNVKQVLFSKIYGPYPNGSQLKEALKIIRPIFPFLDDKSKNHYKFYKQVELVPDILSEEGIKRYKKNIANLKLFFEGKKKIVLKNLEKDMGAYAKRHEFENAGETKRQIFALKHINDIALIKNSPHLDPLLSKERGNFRIEAYDVAHMGGKNMVGVMVVVENGEVAKNEYRKFKIRTQSDANDTGALSEMLERRLAHAGWQMPDLIVVDGSTAQINAAEKVLKRVGLAIPIVAVVKDEHHKPKDILGNEELVTKYKKEILLANSESHRFAINYHKNLRGKSFLK